MRDIATCTRCLRTLGTSGDWFGDLCPWCSDEVNGDWTCQTCGKHGDFERMGGDGKRDPVCCSQTCAHEGSSKKPVNSVRQFKLTVPTYNGSYFSETVAAKQLDEFGGPHHAVLIHEAGGVRIVLGTHDYDDSDKPDIQIERQPNGWVIFLHPVGGSDACGYVYFLDDGRSFLQFEHACGPTPAIQILERGEVLEEIDGPPPDKCDPEIAIDADKPTHRIVPSSPPNVPASWRR